MPQLNYAMSWNDCYDSYMKMVDTKRALLTFEDDLACVAYSYSNRSCRFTGEAINVTSKTGSLENLLKRRGRKNNHVFIKDK
jgi:hypothetical protein